MRQGFSNFSCRLDLQTIVEENIIKSKFANQIMFSKYLHGLPLPISSLQWFWPSLSIIIPSSLWQFLAYNFINIYYCFELGSHSQLCQVLVPTINLNFLALTQLSDSLFPCRICCNSLLLGQTFARFFSKPQHSILRSYYPGKQYGYRTLMILASLCFVVPIYSLYQRKSLLFYFMHLKPVPESTEPPAHPKPDQSSISILILDESFKQTLSQRQTLTSSPTPINFSLQNHNQLRQKDSSARKKGVSWDKFEQLYYFDAILQFVIENPYLTVSWAEWKPLQYYNFIAMKMAEAFGDKGRKPNQLKTKDQNLKNQYFTKRSQKTDLVDVALQKVIYFVNKMRKFCQKDNEVNQKVRKVFNRCDQTLKTYKQLMAEMKKPKQYEIELGGLVKFIEWSQRGARGCLGREGLAEQKTRIKDSESADASFTKLIFPTQI